MGLMLSACSDFLDRKPLTQPDNTTFLSGREQVENYINALYPALPAPAQYGMGVRGEEVNSDNILAEKYDMPVLYSCHPRSRKRLEASGFALDPRVIRHDPLGFHDYNCLQMNAFCVVSDSGTLPEESSFFTSVGHPFPAVCIRTSTERPEALDKACFILAGIDEKSLLQAVDTAVTMNQNGDHGIPVPDYVEENVSAKVVKIIQSYTGVVDKMVWRKF
mgnify:CR=1 FL=1